MDILTHSFYTICSHSKQSNEEIKKMRINQNCSGKFIKIVALVICIMLLYVLFGCSANMGENLCVSSLEDRMLDIDFTYKGTSNNNKWIALYEYEGDGLITADATASRLIASHHMNSVKIEDDVLEYVTGVSFIEFAISKLSYKIEENVLYIEVALGCNSDFSGATNLQGADGLQLSIKDKRILNVKKIILWDEDENNRIPIWGRTNGDSEPKLITSDEAIHDNVHVESDYLEYSGEFTSLEKGYELCYYQLVGDTLYIQPIVNWMPDFAAGGKIYIRFEGEQCSQINRIVFGGRSLPDNQIIWDRERGFLGAEGERGYKGNL